MKNFDVAPPLTRTERRAVLIMALAAVLGLLFFTFATESASRRAARAWPPHITQERSSK
jgi:hypothetical protein